MDELKFIKFSEIVKINGLPEPGYYIEHEENLNIYRTLISYDKENSLDISETIKWFSDRRFLCLDGKIVRLEELIIKSGLEIKWAK